MGIDNLLYQKSAILKAKVALDKLNGEYKTNFQILIEKQGSATPYMKG